MPWLHQKNSMVATEAAMKYFVMGALASGLFLYGISIVYGATGSIQILDISKLLETTSYGENMMVLLGLVFIMSGLIFKLGAVPFHMWVPDVYQGAPTCVTLFIASAPKIAAFGDHDADFGRSTAKFRSAVAANVNRYFCVIYVFWKCIGNCANEY